MITKNIGGSNLFCYDYSDSDSGIITKYNTNKSQIDSLLTQLRLNQDCIQILLLLNQTPPNGQYIQWDGQELSDQNKTNFVNLIQTIAGLEFKFVGIVPEFWGVDDFRLNNLNQDTIYKHFLFLQWVQQVLDQFNFDWCIDLCAELDSSPNCINNAKFLWTWWTAQYFPNAAPCWNATMSLIPQTDYTFVREIFRGADPTGEPNWPARINLHAYRNEAPAMLNQLNGKMGMPKRNIYWGECFTLNEDGSQDVYAQGIHNTILAYRNIYTFERIIQYPTTVFPVGQSERDILPLTFRY